MNIFHNLLGKSFSEANFYDAHDLKKKKLEDISPFCEVPNTPV